MVLGAGGMLDGGLATTHVWQRLTGPGAFRKWERALNTPMAGPCLRFRFSSGPFRQPAQALRCASRSPFPAGYP